MIRRDYLLRMIEQFLQAFSRIRGLKKDQQYSAAAGIIDEQTQKLAGVSMNSIAHLSDAELMAQLMKGEPTQIVPDKCGLLITLLNEHADVLEAENHLGEGQRCRTKALNLLLHLLARGDADEIPEFVPRIDGILAGLPPEAIPAQTQLALAHHYERVGAFAKAEDALFALLEGTAEDSGLIDFGIAFYQRLARQSDAALVQGNLPRGEVEAGLNELKARAHRNTLA
jgi:hypothetical protein